MAAESARKMKSYRPGSTDLKIWVEALLFMLGVFLLSPSPLKAQVEALPEPQLKALFLYNFAKFVDWPQNAFPETNAPLVIGIIGENPFDEYLEQTIQKKKINEHPLVLRPIKSVAEARAAADTRALHIVFIGRSSEPIGTVLGALKDRSVLTVSDTDSFFDAGTMINFVRLDDKVGFVINNGAARKAGLAISSKLLSLAKRVKT